MTEEQNNEDIDSEAETNIDENSQKELDQQTTPEVEEPKSLEVQLEEAKDETAENYDKFMRVTADFENLRRRTEKERTDLLRYGAEKLLKDFLPVVDSFEKAVPEEGMDISTHNPEEFVKGMRLVWKQMLEVLEKNGLEAIEAVGNSFDPNFHQAIQKIECEDTKEEVVGDEYAKGYLLHGRLLRPSMVSVRVPK